MDTALQASLALLFARLGAAVEGLGRFEFYMRLLDVVAAVVPYQAAQIMHYSRHVAPRYLFSINTPRDQQDLYTAVYYRLDPMYRRMFDPDPDGVIHLGSLRNDGPPGDAYFSEFYARTNMEDELAILLPTFGDGVVGLFVQAVEPFPPAAIALLRHVFPLIRALHTAQNRLAILGAHQSHATPDRDRSIVMLDEDHQVVFVSSDLAALEQSDAGFRAALREIVSKPNGTIRRLPSGVLQIHDLEDAIPASRKGRICFFDFGPAAREPLDLAAAIDAFLRHHRLTRRQSDILGLALVGFPSSVIARRFGLSEGTVRNHRKEIHAKLDVTTEREIFIMFLEFLKSV